MTAMILLTEAPPATWGDLLPVLLPLTAVTALLVLAGWKRPS